MLRTSRSILQGRMIPYYSTADMPSAFNPLSISNNQLWLKGGDVTGSTWNDSSGKNRNFTLYNSPTVTSDSGFDCVLFDDASSQYAALTKFLDTSVSYTVVALVNPSTVGYFYGIMAQGDSTHPSFDLRVTPGKLAFEVNPSSSTQVSLLYNPTMVSSTWAMVTGVFDSSAETSTSYVNDTSPGTETSITSFNATGNMYVGCMWESSAKTQYWPGYIGDVLVYSKALTSTEIGQLKTYYGL